MHPFLARRVIYPLLQRRRGGRVRALREELRRTEGYSLDRLQELQQQRLRALLRHAHARVPFYRERFARIGMMPADVSRIEDLAALPPLTKEEVRDHAGALRAVGAGGRLIEQRTSGSTGIPLVVLVTPETRDAWTAAAQRAQGWWGLEMGMRRVSLTNPRGKPPAVERKERWLLNRAEFSVFELDEASLARLYRALLRMRCEVLSGYPSALTHLARYVEAQGRPLRLRAVLTTAEVLYPDQRALLSRAFGAPVVNGYGSAECGFLAGECPSGRLHATAENALIEFEPLPGAGEDGPRALLVTDLINTAMPLIRYRIGDLGLPGTTPCPCGRALPVLELRAGRTEDLVTLPDGRKVDGAVFGVAVEELVREGVAVKQFRAVQSARDRIEVTLAAPGPDGRAARALAQRLGRLLGPQMTITVRTVAQIPLEPTGKLRRFVSLIDESGGAR